MTGIAGLVDGSKVWLAGDRAAVDEGHYVTIDSQPKVFRKGPLVIGFTSSFAMGRALQHRLVLPDLPSNDGDVAALDAWVAVAFADAVRRAMAECGYLKVENSRVSGGCFLLGVHGTLYYFDDDFHAQRPHHGFGAAGSGVSVILGSLFTSSKSADAEHCLITALTAASIFTSTVRGPFDVVVTP